MNHILLLGAGFSRNWGGQLAAEVFDYLIGLPEIRGDEYLRSILWRNKTFWGFENALAEVQVAYIHNAQQHTDHLSRLQQGIARVLREMNEAFFEIPNFEFQQYQARMLRTFLVRFDAIFSLNQDILLDHHYLNDNIHLIAPRRWNGAQLPGMRRIPNREYLGAPSWGRDLWVPYDPSQFKIEDRFQPYFKLHGSSNWRDTEGGQLLVIGGEKSRAIQSHRVLAWYFEMFRALIFRPNTKLMVIGYGFRDQHINDIIIRAINEYGLRMFVIDPLGSGLARAVNPTSNAAIFVRNALDEAFERGLIGASVRRLNEIFGGDEVEHTKVRSFFDA